MAIDFASTKSAARLVQDPVRARLIDQDPATILEAGADPGASFTMLT